MRIVFFLADAKYVASMRDGDGVRAARAALVQSVLVAGSAVRCKIYWCSREEVF